MKMLKVHGSNNDFFILPAANLTKPLSEAELKLLAQSFVIEKVDYMVGPTGFCM